MILQARDLAQVSLAGLPDRWRHTIGVARRAEDIAHAVSAVERDVLIAAAWLHDIGYSGAAHDVGFHPLDGARYLDRHGWPRRVSALVAHHSGASFIAAEQGIDLPGEGYLDERSAVTDALLFADQTVGPTGERMPFEVRMARMLERHGSQSVNAVVQDRRGPYLRAALERVEHRLALHRDRG